MHPASFGGSFQGHGGVTYSDGAGYGDGGCDDCGHGCWFLKLLHLDHCKKCKDCEKYEPKKRRGLLHRKHAFFKDMFKQRTQLEHDYKWSYKPPQGLVYPPRNQPAGVIQYPYYTVKGPTDFFYTGK